MEGFTALVTIVLACQVPSGNTNVNEIASRQLECQKALIQCYADKKKSVKTDPLSVEWEGPLKDCLLERTK